MAAKKEVLEALSNFVVRVAGSKNASDAELNAAAQIAGMLVHRYQGSIE